MVPDQELLGIFVPDGRTLGDSPEDWPILADSLAESCLVILKRQRAVTLEVLTDRVGKLRPPPCYHTSKVVRVGWRHLLCLHNVESDSSAA